MAGQMIVLQIEWTGDDHQCQETYGPWTASADDDLTPHMKQAHGFLQEWQRFTGHSPDSATVILVVDPGEWLAERQDAAIRNLPGMR